MIGSGVRRSKLLLPGRLLGDLPGAEVVRPGPLSERPTSGYPIDQARPRQLEPAQGVEVAPGRLAPPRGEHVRRLGGARGCGGLGRGSRERGHVGAVSSCWG